MRKRYPIFTLALLLTHTAHANVILALLIQSLCGAGEFATRVYCVASATQEEQAACRQTYDQSACESWLGMGYVASTLSLGVLASCYVALKWYSQAPTAPVAPPPTATS